MRIAIAADHAGCPLKAELVPWLEAEGHEVTDLGTDSTAPVDYPRFCAAAARAVVAGAADVGIVLGGSGQGEQIAANKVRGARAALCHDVWMARMARAHNDANVLSMGARVVAVAMAKEIASVFLGTPFDGDRHVARVEQLRGIEDDECQSAGAGSR
ncbi:MAG TPA: ribose 5-phosphate isomerase B [Acidimicrobiales bacterium]|nr:ribose 5-phosphate isomerase B [Acidimicrobiales bacterium]